MSEEEFEKKNYTIYLGIKDLRKNLIIIDWLLKIRKLMKT